MVFAEPTCTWPSCRWLQTLCVVVAVGGLVLWSDASQAEASGNALRAGVITGAVGVSYFSLLVVDETWGTTTCRVCATNDLDRGVRELLVWQNPTVAARISDGLLLGIPTTSMAAAFLVGRRDGNRQGVTDGFVTLEAIAFAGLGTSLAKLTVARRRPFSYYRTFAYPSSVDENRSFWSGHTAVTFAAISSLATVSYHHGWSGGPIVAVGGVLAAGTTGYLRMGADKHWFTDVLVGAVVGTAVGIAVPVFELGKRRDGDDTGVNAAPLVFGGSF